MLVITAAVRGRPSACVRTGDRRQTAGQCTGQYGGAEHETSRDVGVLGRRKAALGRRAWGTDAEAAGVARRGRALAPTFQRAPV
jgi:hypothetical protein